MVVFVRRHVIFPFIRDVSIVSGSNSTISGTTDAGFSLTIGGNQLLRIEGDPGAFLPTMVITMGPHSTVCTVDASLSNSTVTYAEVPAISVLCGGDPACLLRGVCGCRSVVLPSLSFSFRLLSGVVGVLSIRQPWVALLKPLDRLLRDVYHYQPGCKPLHFQSPATDARAA